jgi:hypothetical protein
MGKVQRNHERIRRTNEASSKWTSKNSRVSIPRKDAVSKRTINTLWKKD